MVKLMAIVDYSIYGHGIRAGNECSPATATSMTTFSLSILWVHSCTLRFNHFAFRSFAWIYANEHTCTRWLCQRYQSSRTSNFRVVFILIRIRWISVLRWAVKLALIHVIAVNILKWAPNTFLPRRHESMVFHSSCKAAPGHLQQKSLRFIDRWGWLAATM